MLETPISILATNDACHTRIQALLREKKIVMINMMSGPGAGKTSLLEKLLISLKQKINVGVIEGDLYTAEDAKRLERIAIPVVQINTQGACHLDAFMIEKALEQLPIDELDMIIIENVGNLVCPAEFKIGEHFKMMLSSVTEGNDKPKKYPLMFEVSDAIILSKMDLLPYVPFDALAFRKDIEAIHPGVKLFEVSTLAEKGLIELEAWFLNKLEELRCKEG
ncbi:hydrogenase accessory protein HypB [Sporanaerobium hydrogeniformans]|uniref:Hydrogenase accessory protein HypB n=1 Tax=Sporanaerobium hydrogeniformans TaxID=3072179 RepID=A0AC61DGK1_9FIRM|nr:hydrogenase nickel incorporation protein HypB [Sporanaerobium hydrogeniformans]PHV71861.1 hydrogenase accessory protein HypB [Sporanaerobium hydrogeniformans]